MIALFGDDAQRQRELTRVMLEAGIFIPSGVRGVYGRGVLYRRVLLGLEDAIHALCAPDEPERVAFPPVLPRATLQKTGYMENFPQLCGSLHAFTGDDAAHAALLKTVEAGEPWSPHLSETDLCLVPAACYPLYPGLSGTLPEQGRLFDVTGYCFRREPSDDPARLQSFQMHENVRLGSPEQVIAWRDGWTERGLSFLRSLGLPAERDLANDPFFGRGGRMMKANQRAQELKFELLLPICSEQSPTAIASFNYHQDHFASKFGILQPGGEPAHTACLGFGLDRIVLALFRYHGVDVAGWPAEIRARLLGADA